MTDQAKALAPFINRREKNLAYFKAHFKDIYAVFKEYKMKSMQLNILVESDEVNLISDGQHLYKEGAKAYAMKELELFRMAYREGKKVCSVYPAYHGDYRLPRFGQMALNHLLEKSPLTRKTFSFYDLHDFYPMIVFLGCGLGYHIEKLVTDHNIQNLLVVEPDLDKFAASLYSIDWADICARYDAREGRSLHFILGSESDDYLTWVVTWNKLITLCPQFPLMTLFYNHQGREVFDRVSDRVNKDMLVFMSTWGYYDDEIRQLNNALHNFHMGIKELPGPMRNPSDTPVFIVGGGPSLDARINYLKEVRHDVIVISCGTALRSLAAYDVKPDIHVELESDLSAYITVSQAASDDYFKDIKLVGACHISPLIYQLFGDGRLYYKSESATANLFGRNTGHIIENATPTCSNLGVSLAISMGFKKLFLFGLDFGFKDINNHHSKGSLYYEKEHKLTYNEKKMVKVDAIGGGQAWSTPTYFTSKRTVEKVFQQYREDAALKVYNCSDVAIIEGSEWLPTDAFIPVVHKCKNRKEQDMDYLFNDSASVCDLTEIQVKLENMDKDFEIFARVLNELLPDQIRDVEVLSSTCSKINNYLETTLTQRSPDYCYLVRGTIRHFLFAGFSHAFAIEDEKARLNYMSEWRKAFLNFFESLQNHYRSVVFKEYDVEKDPWVRQAIKDPEDGINPFFA